MITQKKHSEAEKVPLMDTVLMATRTPIRCLHASIPTTVSHSPAIYQVCCRRAPFLSYRSATMTMCFFRKSDLRSRFLSSRKTTFPMRHGFSVSASTDQTSTSSNRNLIVVNSIVIVALAVANRVLYKLALVPMKQYPFFMAQLNTFG